MRRFAPATALAVAPLAIWVAGCNSGLPASSNSNHPAVDLSSPPDMADVPPDLLGGQPSDTYPAPFPDPPQVVTGGGTTLDKPRIIPVFFQNDQAAFVAKVADFETRIGPSSYWAATTSEYGVGPATTTPAVMLAETAPTTIDDRQISTWLTAKIDAGDPSLPAPGDEDLYVIHYPEGTSVTLQGTKSCVPGGFGGYHANAFLDVAHKHAKLSYAVIPRCGINLDTTTETISHELVEAATDPYPYVNPGAYGTVDGDHAYWGLAGGEVGDMCENFSSSYVKLGGDLPYAVQRTWSNAAVAAGHDPCVPAPAGSVYFNAVPEANDYVTLKYGNFGLTMLGVYVPVGESRTIPLDLYSDADTHGPWTVSVRATRGTYLDFSLDRDQGQNGEKLFLTITSSQASPNGAVRFVVTSQLGSASHEWFGMVGQTM